MKTLKQIFICVFCLLAFAACKNETQDASTNSLFTEAETTANKKTGQAFITDDESTPTVLSIAIGSPDHTTLVAAVQAASLENALVNAGPLMVFAPTNDAFAALPEGTVENLLKPENKDALANILKYHVLLETILKTF